MRISATAALLVFGLAGCGAATQKDEEVCLDLIKSVVVDPENINVNGIDRAEVPGDVEDLRSRYRGRDGEISSAHQAVLEMYEKEGVQITKRLISLDVSFDTSFGRSRDKALCRYLSYDGKTELTSFSIGSQHVDQPQLLDFFILNGRPKGLDTLNRL